MTNFYATIARYYDSEHHDKDEDLPFYREIAEDAGERPILIVGSGTGRLALDLAAEGRQVHGIEIEAAMIERANRKLGAAPAADRVEFFHADARTFRTDVRYAVTIIPYNTFMHFLTQTDQKKLLSHLRELMDAGDQLVIDLPNPGEAFGAQDSEAITLERTFLERESGHLVMQQSSAWLDRAEQTMHVTWIYDEIDEEGVVRRTVVPVRLYYYFLNELKLLLAHCGFAYEAAYGDFDGTPYGDGMPRMIVTARAR